MGREVEIVMTYVMRVINLLRFCEGSNVLKGSVLASFGIDWLPIIRHRGYVQHRRGDG